MGEDKYVKRTRIRKKKAHRKNNIEEKESGIYRKGLKEAKQVRTPEVEADIVTSENTSKEENYKSDSAIHKLKSGPRHVELIEKPVEVDERGTSFE